jgi:PPM family protein phosphatase
MSIDDSTSVFPPASAVVQVEFGAESRRGANRPVNEDHYVIIKLGRNQETLLTSLPEASIARRFDEYGYAMVVADGIGGTGTGEIASRTALATLVQLVLYFGKWNLRVDDMIARDIIARAERFYRHVDAAMLSEVGNGLATSLQTTLTALFGAGRDLFFAHVGHSRAYLYRDRELMRLTRDHTIGRGSHSQVNLAPLVDVNVAARDLKHILTETIGMGGARGPRIDLERFHVENDDVVLVCTNGLTDALEEEVVADVLSSGQSPSDLCTTLVELAMKADAEDDVTALVGRYRFPSAAG